MKNLTSKLRMCAFLGVIPIFLSFSRPVIWDDQTIFLQSTLNKHHDITAISGGLKKFELEVTNTGLCRYRKTYSNGKIEFFALHIGRIKEVVYLGNVQSGKLVLNTVGDDVIVQTFNDKKGGDVDTMANSMMIPLKALEIEDINAIYERMEVIKKGASARR